MRVAFGDRTVESEAVDLAGVDPGAVAAAVRGPDDERVACPTPGPTHEYVGVVRPGMALPVRAALAAAARTRGATAPQDEELDAVLAERDAIEVPAVDLAAARERVATAGTNREALRERVARVSGKVEALRERGDDTAEAAAELGDAIRELSEVETEHAAAEQALSRARAEARDARDARERRLRLTDRADNLRRAARESLAAARYDAFADALTRLPGDADPGESPGEFEGDPVTAALGVAAVADLTAPVVLAAGRFPSAAAAREALDAPVLRVEI